MDLAKARMAKNFDAKHTLPELEHSAYIRLARMNRGYKLPDSTKFSTILHGPFKIRRKISPLAYELDLPSSLKIHPVISIIHLEPHKPDKFERKLPELPDPVVINNEDEFEIDQILDQKAGHCLVRWRGLNESTWEPIANIREDAPEVLRRFQEKRRNQRRK